MRKIIIALCALMTLCSCEKAIIQADGEETEGTGNLKLFVSQFENTPFESLTRTAVSEVCTRLNYGVYTLDGTRIKQVNQTVDQASFGKCSFQLEEGTYLLVVVGHSSNGNPTMSDPTCIKFTNSQGFSDTFLFCYTIPLTGEPVEMGITMKRIVSLCRFVITDDIPADVQKMRFNYTGGSGAFDATITYGCVNSKQEVTFDVTGGQKQFDLYTFLHDMEGTISLTVTALNAAGAEVSSRKFEVPMTQNHITWVTGNFFTGSGSTDNTSIYEITVDADWAGEHHINF